MFWCDCVCVGGGGWLTHCRIFSVGFFARQFSRYVFSVSTFPLLFVFPPWNSSSYFSLSLYFVCFDRETNKRWLDEIDSGYWGHKMANPAAEWADRQTREKIESVAYCSVAVKALTATRRISESRESWSSSSPSEKKMEITGKKIFWKTLRRIFHQIRHPQTVVMGNFCADNNNR